MTGATSTPTGTPAFASAAISCSRRCGAGGARIELARELAVEHRDRDEDARQLLRGHRREQVDVALDQRALGGDRQRMIARGEHFDHRTRDLPFALDRLVRIGVGAERDGLAAVARLRQLRAQQLRGVRLGEELASRSRGPATGRG